MRVSALGVILFSLLIFSLYVHRVHTGPIFLVVSDDFLNDGVTAGDEGGGSGESSEFDEFPDPDSKSEEELDPGSWLPIFEPDDFPVQVVSPQYYSGVHKILAAVSEGNAQMMEEAVTEIEAVAAAGNPHAQSVIGFVYRMGMMRNKSATESFMYHRFAAKGGNMQSKMALAFTYTRQGMYEKAVKLYAEVAEAAVNSFLIWKDLHVVVDPIRIHRGTEENKDALSKSIGEEGEGLQILKSEAEKGGVWAMYKIGVFYYFGRRGVRRDYTKVLYCFSRAVEKGEPNSMELLGEIYARGVGIERNYTKAFGWLMLAAKQGLHSAYNGIGYLYLKGYDGVDEKNYTKAREYFLKAVDNEDPNGHYNLGVLYLKGIGVEKDVRKACKYFITAANAGLPKASYQVAKMFHTGIGLTKYLEMATSHYKLVAEKGPWSYLSRWAVESYMKGDVGKALLLYSRMAELGYEVAQSNAAWIIETYGERSMCMGVSGLCTDKERLQLTHSFWWRAAEQGNGHAALLVGDAYYYGRGTERDFVRAAEAYMYAEPESNAQALFHLGYMHEHGQGLPFDLDLAKRYYDQTLENDPSFKLPVTLAIARLWIRRNFPDSVMVRILDSLPEVYSKVEALIEKNTLLEEGNVPILIIFICLVTGRYLRKRHRRNGVVDPVDADMARPFSVTP